METFIQNRGRSRLCAGKVNRLGASMKIAGPILIVLATAILVALGFVQPSRGGTSVGTTSGSTLSVLKPAAATPEQGIANFLSDVRRRDWSAAYLQLANSGEGDSGQLARSIGGSDGSLRSLSTLERWELSPLGESANAAEVRAVLHWSTPVGPADEVRDVKTIKSGNIWKVTWPAAHSTNVPVQIISVNYLRWDLVTPPTSKDEWGGQNMDSPRVRILSMNAVEYQGGSVVMGEVVNEDTIPAFVNVNASLIGEGGQAIDEESSFDKISHVLLPKQVSPYRIDFPTVRLQTVKNVHMDVNVSVVPAAADPVIGVMDQKQETDVLAKSVLRGTLLNESGQVVNVPHVIASFYDNSGKIIWVSDGYVQRALYPQTPEPFAVEIPEQIAGKVKTYHVLVNQYSIGKD
ncbi:MAG: hypothetical protein LAO20_15935 [Acidobacteriia bacterium]|nr:hypothetical protein [Terriglobia bacterium]